MMIVQAQGLFWDTDSPSHYRLSPAHYDMKGQCIDVCYLGNEWRLFQELADGAVLHEWFPDRDAAIALVASCFKNAGT